MKTKRPLLQRKLGRTVENFDGPGWGRKSLLVMEEALRVKFNQPKYRKELQKTGDHLIVEASPYDR